MDISNFKIVRRKIMELLKLMSDRYTCRRYSEKNVKEEDLNKILEAGRVAPTSHNNQPQRIYVVKSEEAKEKLMKDFAYNYKAPCYLVCGYNVDEVWRNDLDGDRESGDIDVSIVITHMMLMAEELSLGYHREDDRPSKLHTIRRSNEELVKFL